ncbi:MAG: phosphotransferase [Nocardioides sp.]|nr:phosphotransferase [Nocardioides sp.]
MRVASSSGGDQRLTLSEAQVEQVVREGYGLNVVSQRRLGGEVDLNVWIKTDGATEFLLKVSRGTMSPPLLWQEKVHTHLAEVAPELPVPRLIAGQSGAKMLPIEISGDPLVVRLLSWMPGRMLADIPELPDHLLFELGAIAARMTEALASLDVEEDLDESHLWDIRKAREAVDAALPFVSDPMDRAAVSQLMRRFDQVLGDLRDLPAGVVHQDLNDFNVLAAPDPSGRLVITGVIDVNDSLLTVRVAELAIAVAYAMLRQSDPLGAAASVVAGFNSVVRLDPAEIRVIFPLAGARLCVNAATWRRRTTESSHPYGEDRMRHTWPTLHQLAEITTAEAERRLGSACGAAVSHSQNPEV